MASTWGENHLLQPTTCVANTDSWTDNPIVVHVTKIKAQHVNELRAAIGSELSRRGFAAWSWTDDPATVGLGVKSEHIEEMRAAVENIKTGDCAADSDYCPEDTSDAVAWEDEPIVKKVTDIKKVHMDNIRNYINSMSSSCICESEQCEHCADCGYRYNYCNHNGVACNNSQSVGGCGQTVSGYSCASVNSPVGAVKPYSSTGVNWNGTVPWVMGTADRPSSAWHNWDFYSPPGASASGGSWSDWSCKCNPYTWTT